MQVDFYDSPKMLKTKKSEPKATNDTAEASTAVIHEEETSDPSSTTPVPNEVETTEVNPGGPSSILNRLTTTTSQQER